MAGKHLKIRGHHLLCVFGFRGLGYSPQFVENMTALVRSFFAEEPAEVEIVAGCDDICRACPHVHDGECGMSEDAGPVVRDRDRAVLDRLGLAPGMGHSNDSLRCLVAGGVQGADLEELCAGCEWFPLGYCGRGLAEFKGARS